MPFVIVKMTKGRSADQKKELMRRITAVVSEEADCPKEVVQVVIDDQYELNEWSVGGISWEDKIGKKESI